MKNTITQCENCPFNVPGGEYNGYCKHPLVDKSFIDPNEEWKGRKNEQKSIYYDFDFDTTKLKTNSTSYGYYHFETKAIPKWCPIRSLEHINVGVEIKVNLDEQLFEENFTDNNK